MSLWYRTGTVSVTNGQAVVIGAGTAWLAAEIQPGDAIVLDARDYEVLSVDGNKEMTLATPYLGATTVGMAYVIKPLSAIARLVQLSDELGQLLGSFGEIARTQGVGRFDAGQLIDNILRPSLRGKADDDTGINLPGNGVVQVVSDGRPVLTVAEDGATGMQLRNGLAVYTNKVAIGANQASLVIREKDFSGPQGYDPGVAPRLSMYWSGVFAAQLTCDSNGLKLIDDPGSGYAGLRLGGLGVNGRMSITSGGSPWFGMGAAATGASYGAFYKGGTSTLVGLIGTDGGAIIGPGAGDNFGIRAEGHLLLNSQQGVVRPTGDNDTSLGQSGYRWASIYLGSNPIVTSDARKKLDIKDSLGLDFINLLRPVSYRIADAKVAVEIVDDGFEDTQEPVYEVRQVAGVEIVIVDGKPVQRAIQREERIPVVDLLPLTDESGAPVLGEEGKPVMHPVPRMHTVRRAKTRERREVNEGVRRHQGLLAQQVLEALESIGLAGKDFAGLIHDEDTDTWGLRYEQFIAPIIKSLQQLAPLLPQVEELASTLRSLIVAYQALEARLRAVEERTNG